MERIAQAGQARNALQSFQVVDFADVDCPIFKRLKPKRLNPTQSRNLQNPQQALVTARIDQISCVAIDSDCLGCAADQLVQEGMSSYGCGVYVVIVLVGEILTCSLC